jgi:hypothetical protein
VVTDRVCFSKDTRLSARGTKNHSIKIRDYLRGRLGRAGGLS